MTKYQTTDVYDSSKRDEFTDAELREFMKEELDKRWKLTRKNLEQYIDFEGENND